MNKIDLQRMFNYHYWAHRRVWDCVMKLTDEQFEADLHYSVGSIRTQCVHTMTTERFWVDLVRGTVPEGRASVYETGQFTTRETIRAAWDELESETWECLSVVENAHLDAIIEYDFPWCGAQRHPR
jgi:uncharacterized damage-inducible protein DinB